jgi:Family of unknown function (DUF6308)
MLLFDTFADIRGVGFSKMTKALHRKRPALIPMLDSVVQTYLTTEDPGTRSQGSFGERATALVRSYKRDLDWTKRELKVCGGEGGQRRRGAVPSVALAVAWLLRPVQSSSRVA